MPISDLFSKRQKRLRGEIPEIFTYDEIPNGLRVKVIHIIQDVFGKDEYGDNSQIEESYGFIHKTLCREYGLFKLGNSGYNEREEQYVLNFLLHNEDNERVLDVIELTFKYAYNEIRESQSYYHYTESKLHLNSGINELNDRFKEEGIGYSFEGGEIIKVDST